MERNHHVDPRDSREFRDPRDSRPAGRVLYKSKLCKLWQRGHCGRDFCTFAHGEKELNSPVRVNFDDRHRQIDDRAPRRAPGAGYDRPRFYDNNRRDDQRRFGDRGPPRQRPSDESYGRGSSPPSRRHRFEERDHWDSRDRSRSPRGQHHISPPPPRKRTPPPAEHALNDDNREKDDKARAAAGGGVRQSLMNRINQLEAKANESKEAEEQSWEQVRQLEFDLDEETRKYNSLDKTLRTLLKEVSLMLKCKDALVNQEAFLRQLVADTDKEVEGEVEPVTGDARADASTPNPEDNVEPSVNDPSNVLPLTSPSTEVGIVAVQLFSKLLEVGEFPLTTCTTL